MKIVLSVFTAISLWAVSASALTFVHPGALSSRAELDFIKGRIQAGAQPWTGELELIKASRYAHMGPHGLANINSKNEDANISRYDAAAAYSQALLWYFTGDEAYARSSIAILNSWSDLQAFTAGTLQDRLQAGWIGAVMAPAAEIMRLYPGWSAAEIGKLQAMFRRAFYPQLTTASPWNGNNDLTQIDAMMAIAVFNEDEALFRQGIERLNKRSRAYFYLTADGPLPHAIEGDNGDLKKFWYYPVKWVDGLTQETCRDNGHHAQYALGSALHAAETAWHQGVDVYTGNQARYTAAMELLAQQFLAGSMLGVSTKDLPDHERSNTWEIGYNHYHNRVGLSLPYTQRLITEQIRTDSLRAIWNLNYETLTHAELPGGHR
ncbi:MAG: alginate lyase family protein [Opitutae bacterium]